MASPLSISEAAFDFLGRTPSRAKVRPRSRITDAAEAFLSGSVNESEELTFPSADDVLAEHGLRPVTPPIPPGLTKPPAAKPTGAEVPIIEEDPSLKGPTLIESRKIGPVPPVEEGTPESLLGHGGRLVRAGEYAGQQIEKLGPLLTPTRTAAAAASEATLGPSPESIHQRERIEQGMQAAKEPVVKPSLLIGEGGEPDITRELIRGFVEGAEGLTSPENFGIISGLGVLGKAAQTATSPAVRGAWNVASTALSAYFAKEMGTGAYESGKAAYRALEDGDYETAARDLGLGTTEALFAFLSAAHAAGKTRAASQRFREGYEQGQRRRARVEQDTDARLQRAATQEGGELVQDPATGTYRPASEVRPAAPVDVDTVYERAVVVAKSTPQFGRTRLKRELGLADDQVTEVLARLERDGQAFRQDSPDGRTYWTNRPPKPKEPEPEPPAMPVEEMPAAFQTEVGQYELIAVEGSNVRYRFLDQTGVLSEQSMPLADWQKIVTQHASPISEGPVPPPPVTQPEVPVSEIPPREEVIQPEDPLQSPEGQVEPVAPPRPKKARVWKPPLPAGMEPAGSDAPRVARSLFGVSDRQAVAISIPEARATAGLPKEQFDRALMDLARSGDVVLHEHDAPFLLPEERRNELVQSGDTYYIGASWTYRGDQEEGWPERKYGTQDIAGVQGRVGEGQELVQAEPLERGGGEATETGGVLQEHGVPPGEEVRVQPEITPAIPPAKETAYEERVPPGTQEVTTTGVPLGTGQQQGSPEGAPAPLVSEAAERFLAEQPEATPPPAQEALSVPESAVPAPLVRPSGARRVPTDTRASAARARFIGKPPKDSTWWDAGQSVERWNELVEAYADYIQRGGMEGEPLSIKSFGVKWLEKVTDQPNLKSKPSSESVYLGSGLGALQRWFEREKPADMEPLDLPDDEVTRRMRSASMAKPETGKLKEAASWFIESFKRTYKHLPQTDEYAALRFRLGQLEKAHGVTTHKAAQAVIDTVGKMQPNQYEAFAFEVVLDDLVARIEQEQAEGRELTAEDLPFGFSSVEAIKQRRDMVADQADEVVKNAIQLRKTIQEQTKEAYADAMKAAGYTKDLRETLNRKDYFHHRVLAHLEAKIAGGATRQLKLPKGRGWLRHSEVNPLDYSTDYIQSEFEVLQQMMLDTVRAETIAWIAESEHNIAQKLKQQAKAHNKAAVMPHFQELADQWNNDPSAPPTRQPKTAEQMYRWLLHWRQGKAIKDLGKLAAEGDLPTGNGRWETFVEEMADSYQQYQGDVADEAEHPQMGADMRDVLRYAAWVLKNAPGTPASKAAALLYKGIEFKQKYIRTVAGQNWVNPKPADMQELVDRFAKDTHATWQPDKGSLFFMGDSVPEELAKRIMEAAGEEVGVKASDLRKVLIRGSLKRQLVLPNEVAAQLDDLGKAGDDNVAAKVAQSIMSAWKKSVLVNPARVVKYNLRNLSGDAEAVFVGNPGAFRKAPRALVELWRYFRRGDVSPDLETWMDRGGIESLLQVQEIGELNRLNELEHLLHPTLKDKAPPGLKQVKAVWNGAWGKSQKWTNFREAILRYAAYLDAIEREKTGNRRYGASNPAEVNALEDPLDRAFKLSNDLLGAYDEVSVGGRWLRRNLLPFWSWQEVNMKRFIRLIRNAANDTERASALGRAAGARGAVAALRLGKLLLALLAVKVGSEVWNNLVFPEVEKSLPESERQRTHINMWDFGNGEVLTFYRIGILDDILDWVGLDGSIEYARQYLNGRRTLKEIVVEMGKSPANKVVGLIGPQYKAPGELLTGRSVYPDVWNRREIRDRGEYVARMFGMEGAYRRIMGKPEEQFSIGRAGLKWAFYLADVEQTNYYEVKDIVRRFNEKKHGKSAIGYNYSAKAEALYSMRMALRYNDRAALEKYTKLYISLGGKVQNAIESIDRLHPLNGLKKRDKNEFLRSLDGEQKLQVERAEEWWRRNFKLKAAQIRAAAR